jgi:PEGA domain-containing protein
MTIIDCLGYRAGLYFPPFQTQAVINQSKSPSKNPEDAMKFLSQIASFILIAVLGISSFAQINSSTQSPVPDQSNQAPQGAPAFGLGDGTPVKLRLARTMSSAEARTGETVHFEVLEDIKVGEIVVVPRGGIAWATVTLAQPKRRMGRGGKLNMNIDAVRLITGEKAALRAVKEVQGNGRTGVMTGAIVASGILFFPAAPFFLFMRGKDITIPQGAEITAYINGDISLDPRKFTPPSPDQGPIAPTTPEAITGQEASPGDPESSSIMIKSIPEGAEISIDDQLVGYTPSTMRLKFGEHTISIKKSGFVLWERKITLSPGVNITVDTALEKTP